MCARPPQADVDWWWLSLGGEQAARLAADGQRLLAPEERQAEGQFSREEVRRRWRCTRAMVRLVLSHYADVPPADWRFRRTSLGKPEVVGPEELPLAFNLAHSGQMIVCGVSGRGPLGVDVEQIRLRPRHLDLARRFFAPEEVAWVEAQTPAEQPEAFLRIWTLKEAYLKARGMGLALPLKGFSFQLEPQRVRRVAFNDRCPDDPQRWRFAEWSEADPREAVGYRMAVALGDGRSAEPITLRRCELASFEG